MAHGMIVLTGNTFAVKDQIKRIPGAQFDAARKAWVIDRDRLTMKERQQADAACHALRASGVTITRQ